MRQENSVLFALHDLRSMEAERVAQEAAEEARQRQAVLERQAAQRRAEEQARRAEAAARLAAEQARLAAEQARERVELAAQVARNAQLEARLREADDELAATRTAPPVFAVPASPGSTHVAWPLMTAALGVALVFIMLRPHAVTPVVVPPIQTIAAKPELPAPAPARVIPPPPVVTRADARTHLPRNRTQHLKAPTPRQPNPKIGVDTNDPLAGLDILP